MRHIAALLICLVLVGCSGQRTDELVQAAVAQTLTAVVPTAAPTNTPAPTDTPEPAATATSAPTKMPKPTATEVTVDSVRRDVERQLVDILSDIQDVEGVNSVRFVRGALEIEIKTVYMSKDRQPDVSYEVVRLVAIALSKADTDKLRTLFGGEPVVNLTTYSTLGEYRYHSSTNLEDLRLLADYKLTYDEWVKAAQAEFR